MASRKFKVHGLTVEVWEKSFRVEGMSSTVFTGNISASAIEELLNALMVEMEKKAMEKAVAKITSRLGAMLRDDI